MVLNTALKMSFSATVLWLVLTFDTRAVKMNLTSPWCDKQRTALVSNWAVSCEFCAPQLNHITNLCFFLSLLQIQSTVPRTSTWWMSEPASWLYNGRRLGMLWRAAIATIWRYAQLATSVAGLQVALCGHWLFCTMNAWSDSSRNWWHVWPFYVKAQAKFCILLQNSKLRIVNVIIVMFCNSKWMNKSLKLLIPISFDAHLATRLHQGCIT